jgi:DNA-binding GntR family transcriptional regulator
VGPPAKRAKTSRARKTQGRSTSTSAHPPEGDIYRRIHVAIAERRLLPGARLVEDQLGEVFGVSRMRIRSVLHALARDKVVTLQRNRGAIVAYPSVKEAREVFAARRLIEVALAHEVVKAVDEEALKQLREHIRKEREGEESGDRAFELRASHEFHTLLADIVGNSVIVGVLRDLMARSSLITAIYERPDTSGCSHVSHASLIKLIERKDGEGLAKAMLTHLEQLEGDLILYEREEQVTDLKAVFAGR